MENTQLGEPDFKTVQNIDKRYFKHTLDSTTSACYQVCESKGAQMPAERTPQNLSSTIGTITGGGGTSDYNLLSNKPSIRQVVLSGDKEVRELGGLEQRVSMPSQSDCQYIESYHNAIIQYIGEDDALNGFYKGHFYECVESAGIWWWKELVVSASGTSYKTVSIEPECTLTPFAYNNLQIVMPNTVVKLTLPTPEDGKVVDLVIRLDATAALPSSFEIKVADGCYLVRELLTDDVEFELGNIYMLTYTYWVQDTDESEFVDEASKMIRATVASKATTIAVDKTYVFYTDGSQDIKLIVGELTQNDLAVDSSKKIEKIVVGTTVTSIGEFACANQTDLVEIELPPSVIAIKKGAFSNCTSLYALKIPGSVTVVQNSAFAGCESLEEMEVGCSITKLPKNAFYGLKSMSYLACYQDTAKVVKNNAKRLAIGLPGKQIVICVCKDAIIIFNDGDASSGGPAPEETVFKYSNGTTVTKYISGTIGIADVPNKALLTYVRLGNIVTSVAASTFEGCTSLVTLSIPKSVTTINYSAFQQCTSLLALELPASLTTLGSYAFSGCTSLFELTVKGDASTFSTGCFSNCPNLTEVIFEQNTCEQVSTHISTWGIGDQGNIVYCICTNGAIVINAAEESSGGGDTSAYSYFHLTDGTTIVKLIEGQIKREHISDFYDRIKTVELGNAVTEIYSEDFPEGRAFESCTQMISISIPTSVTKIGVAAFDECTSLKSIIIPSSVTELGSNVFDNCTSLEEAEIGWNVQTLGGYLFNNCFRLESVTMSCPATAIPDSTFLSLDALNVIIFSQCSIEQVTGNASRWGIGLPNQQTVICWCTNGFVIINDKQDSSGQAAYIPDWNKVTKALEACSPTDFDGLKYKGTNAILKRLKVGYKTFVKYSIQGTSTPVMTEWNILGYNASIPEAIKYKRVSDGTLFYLKSTSGDGLLQSIQTSQYFYSDKDCSSASGQIRLLGSEQFAYGNNTKYQVPISFYDYSNNEYKFCGYNITIQSDSCLNWDNSYYRTFNAYSGKCSTWSASEIRSWLNSTIYSKLAFNHLTQNISKAVNRTWVHDSNRSGLILDSNYCTHTADSLWLLGMGNINCTGKSGSDEYFKDQYYDTSIFSDVFKHRDDLWTTETEPRYRVKYYLTSNGTKSSSTYWWWLRSASSDYYTGVGGVSDDGYVNDDSCYSSCGVAPACVMG